MKKLLILFLVGVLTVAHTNHGVHTAAESVSDGSKKDLYVLSVDPSTTSQLRHDATYGDLVYLFDVFVKLTNCSDSVLNYSSMSCSYDDFYTINNKQVDISGSNCDKNIPVILRLLPHQSATVKLQLRIPENLKAIHSTYFRVGRSLHTEIRKLSKTDTSNIIWSNEISTP